MKRRSISGALGLIGLARRASGAHAGSAAAVRALRNGDAMLVVTARDAARGQLAKIERAAFGRGVRVVAAADRRTLGVALGRGPTTAVAVTHPGFAERIARILIKHDSAEIGDRADPDAANSNERVAGAR